MPARKKQLTTKLYSTTREKQHWVKTWDWFVRVAFFSLLFILVYFCLLYSILWLSLEEACPVQDLRRVSVHTTFNKQSWDMQWDWITVQRSHISSSLLTHEGSSCLSPWACAAPTGGPSWKEHPQSSLPQIPADILCAHRSWQVGSGGSAEDAFALQPRGWVLGWLWFCSFGTGCWAARPSLGVSWFVHPSLLSSSSSSLGHPGVHHGRYQFLCCARWYRWWISRAYMECDSFFLFPILMFFLPRSHRFLVCSPFTKRVCKGIPQSMQNGHLHILLTESVLSFQL